MKEGEGEADRLPTTESGGDGGCRSCILTVAGGGEPGLSKIVVEWSISEATSLEVVAN